jgi:hypothetical protein
VDAEIRPEPSVDERAAILAALERELGEPPDPRGFWWRRGLDESLSGGPLPLSPER